MSGFLLTSSTTTVVLYLRTSRSCLAPSVEIPQLWRSRAETERHRMRQNKTQNDTERHRMIQMEIKKNDTE